MVNGAEIPPRPPRPPGAVEGVGPNAYVTVQVSRELLEQLGDWSPPVQVMITHVGSGWEMIARTHSCFAGTHTTRCSVCEQDEHVLVCTGERRSVEQLVRASMRLSKAAQDLHVREQAEQAQQPGEQPGKQP
jgi:hypothetical protein